MTLEGGECVTVSGVACKFPFHWKGADHMDCTWVDATGRPWCEDVNGRRANCNMDVCEGKSQEQEIFDSSSCHLDDENSRESRQILDIDIPSFN